MNCPKLTQDWANVIFKKIMSSTAKGLDFLSLKHYNRMEKWQNRQKSILERA